ncbi:DUF5690 family protein [Pseudofulvibacter geojedonensis]|uniref:DUF5690 family protein n=1 Tax=Pseudofulvibacter geojedonensis TaxID=1123758 RepID=A0ABW3I0F0_9FLAO
MFKQEKISFILTAALGAFGAYFCMYAYRKPFTVATFDELSYFGVDYKILLIIAQILGYTLSKFLGIKIISEMKASKRIKYLIGFVLFAEVALLGFALIPKPYNILCLFLNGLPLGMIWGIVFSYIEGRKVTEILGVILCSSFIVSSGVVKSIGKYLIDVFNVSEFWMPFATGAIFLFPLVFFAFLLEKLPQPTDEDKLIKSIREPLDRKARISLFKSMLMPLTLIIFFYMVLTAVRDFRDNFARELWDSLGFQDSIAIYSFSELPITILVLIILGIIGSIKRNYKAFILYHLILIIGSISIFVATSLFQYQLIGPVSWMIITGFSLYICYVPFNGLFFDRMIATYKIKGNVGFLIYIADAFGYLGSILILFYKNFGNANLSWLEFYIYLIYLLAIIGFVVSILSYGFFKKKKKKELFHLSNSKQIIVN